jgi:excisionase family DNA binding protein
LFHGIENGFNSQKNDAMESKQLIFDLLSKKELEDLIVNSLEEVLKNNPFNCPPDQELLTREQACMLLKVDPSTLWRWTNKGKVTAYGIGYKRLYKKEELIESLIKLD